MVTLKRKRGGDVGGFQRMVGVVKEQHRDRGYTQK